MRLTLLALLFSPLAVFAAAAPASVPPPSAEGTAAEPKLAGRIDDGRYFSATGLFSLPVPDLDPETAGLLDTPNIVVFRDRASTFISIRAFPLSPAEVEARAKEGPQQHAVRYFKDLILPEFKGQFPGTTAESATYVPDLEGGALLAYLLIPNGSAFEVDPLVRNHPDTKVPPAKQLVVFFVHADHVFMVSSEIAERITDLSSNPYTTKDEDRILRERLLGVISSMRFAAPEKKTAATPAPVAPPAAAVGK